MISSDHCLALMVGDDAVPARREGKGGEDEKERDQKRNKYAKWNHSVVMSDGRQERNLEGDNSSIYH